MLIPKPCPAGKCDAELYAVSEPVFCPKCGAKNPDFRLKTEIARVSLEKEPKIDLETGVIKWKRRSNELDCTS